MNETIRQRRQERMTVMHSIYDLADGTCEVAVRQPFSEEVGGLTLPQIQQIISYWISKGCLARTMGPMLISLTAAGIDAVELADDA
jgi:hypothetical protein